jgi:Uma2 family endonuclease
MSEPLQADIVITPEAYLAGELGADLRSEYVGGRVYPMPGVSDVHDRLCRNLGYALERFLEDQPCQVHGPDLKLRSHSGSVYYYPDLMICCDPEDNAPYWRDRPRYVFEISSPETKRTDEQEKKIAYYHLPSIESYVQIAQEARRVIVNRREEGLDYWREETLTQPDDRLRLDGLGFSLPLARLYRRTPLDAPAAA